MSQGFIFKGRCAAGLLILAGTALGALSRLLDVYTQNLGNIFSQLAIWILIGTLISLSSRTARRAAVNVLCFCLGMLAAYYAAAALMRGVYSRVFIVGWTVFALCTPPLAMLAWRAGKRDKLGRLLSAGIVLAAVLSSVVLFDGFRVYDAVIDAILVYVLFFKRSRQAAQ